MLKLVAVGKENNQIAQALFISPKTVQNHVSSILAKLQLRTTSRRRCAPSEAESFSRGTGPCPLSPPTTLGIGSIVPFLP